MARRADIENLHTRKLVVTLIPAMHQFDIRRVLKSNSAHTFLVFLETISDTMKFFEARFVLFAFAVLSDIYCSDDLDDRSVGEVGENVDYQNYQDLDMFSSLECEEHEEYSECSGDRTCQKTCENMDQWETMSCARTKVCIRGCVCEDGYVRDDNSGVCVRENSCARVRH